MIHERLRRTDRQTEDMQSQNHALHYSASRGEILVDFNIISASLTIHWAWT